MPTAEARNAVILLLTLLGVIYVVAAVHEDPTVRRLTIGAGAFLLAYVFARVTGR